MIYVTANILAPAMVIGATFFASKLRAWLEKQARDAVSQGELMDLFQKHVSDFLRSSDAVKHSELREMLRWSGYRMMDGSKLIRSVIIFNHKIRSGDIERPTHDGSADPFKDLSDEAKHSFARAMGYALLISSYQSIWFGQIYRSMLTWVVNFGDKEVKEPEQVVYRYRRVKSYPAKYGQLATAR